MGRVARPSTGRWSSGRISGADDLVVVLLPDSGRGYLSKIYNDQWMTDLGFLKCHDGPCAGDVMANKSGPTPELVIISPDDTGRRAVALMHEFNVSQVIVSVTTELPLAEKEVIGTVSELSLMERTFADPTVLDRPVSEVMGARLAMIGIGEPIPRLAQTLETAPALLVLDGGHPVGVLSRSDLLSFLGARS